MENATQAYDAFNRLWGKVPRTCRVDRENHLLMLDIRAYFDGIIETAKRAAIVDLALAANASPNARSGGLTSERGGPAPEDAEPADPVRQALRLLRTLSDLELEMVKAVLDLHKFPPEDFVDIVNVIRDTHCMRCGEWLDDDDQHENCPVPEEDDADDGREAATVPGVQQPVTAPSIVTPTPPTPPTSPTTGGQSSGGQL